MPTKKRKLARRPAADVSPAVVQWLLDGEWPTGGGEGFWAVLDNSHPDHARRLWNELRDGLLPGWIADHPGTRPWAWWLLDAPREALTAGRSAGELHPHRRRLGGTGTPCYEVLNYVPEFCLGVPASWVSGFDEAYYNGRALDIHGAPIGTEYHEGRFAGRAIDPTDPPRFEAQAAYLDRHNLLSASERRRLTAKDFEPEAIASAPEDDDAAEDADGAAGEGPSLAVSSPTEGADDAEAIPEADGAQTATGAVVATNTGDGAPDAARGGEQ